MGNCMCIPSGKVRSKLQALKHVPHTVRSLFEEHAGEKGFLDVEDVQRFLNSQVSLAQLPQSCKFDKKILLVMSSIFWFINGWL